MNPKSDLLRQGRAVLAAVVAVVSASTAPSAGAATPAPIPVVISNSPVTVESTPAAPLALSADVPLNSSGEGFMTVEVPAGKRFVAQTVSVYRVQSPATGSSVQVYVIASLNGVTNYYALAPVVAVGSRFPGATQAMTFYVDAGSTIQFAAYGTASTGSGSVHVTVTGYMAH